MKLSVEILTPEWNRSLQADAVFLPGTRSPFEVLPGHAAIISSLDPGAVVVRCDCQEETIQIKGGVVRVSDNRIQICAEV